MELFYCGVSTEIIRMKRLLLLPACLVGLTLALRAQVDDPPPPPPPPQPPKVVLTKFVPPSRERNEFYQRNPGVARVFWKSENDIVVVHKDKTQFVFNMKNKQEKDAFREKYGDAMMTPPPPPPPLPPPAPQKKQS